MSAKTVIPCVPKNLLESSVYESSLNICIVSAASITHLAQRKNHQLFVTSLKNIEKALAPQEAVNILAKLLREYHEFATLFSWEKFNKLPSHCPYDHIISLLSDKEPLKGSLYNMSRDELLMLQKYLKEHLFKGFIRVSSSSAASPVIFVKKPEGGLWLCVNYRGLNNLTVKNCYPLPLIWETLNLMAFSVIFTKLLHLSLDSTCKVRVAGVQGVLLMVIMSYEGMSTLSSHVVAGVLMALITHKEMSTLSGKVLMALTAHRGMSTLSSTVTHESPRVLYNHR